jgi:hypothetical protein
MLGSMSEQLNGLEDHMSQNNPDEGPQLTPSGEPHPLEEGGYDSNADEARPASESDVAALEGRSCDSGNGRSSGRFRYRQSLTSRPPRRPRRPLRRRRLRPTRPPVPTSVRPRRLRPPRSADAAPTPPDDKGKAKSRR